MRSPYNFIVKPLNGRRYDNIKEIADTEFITSVSQEDHVASNRFAEVIALPINYKGPVKEGDTLLVHHNVFKFYYDMQGRQKSGRSFLKDDLFLIDNEQFFLYKNNDTWMAHSKYCFIKPIDYIQNEILHRVDKTEEEHVGVIKYINHKTLKPGDRIAFTKNSEYKFTIEDEKLYRMRNRDICILF